jgi:hypothetical protein
VSKEVTVSMSVYQAAAIRQVLFDAQKGYTYTDSCPQRVFEIREVITDLDDAISSVVEE